MDSLELAQYKLVNWTHGQKIISSQNGESYSTNWSARHMDGGASVYRMKKGKVQTGQLDTWTEGHQFTE